MTISKQEQSKAKEIFDLAKTSEDKFQTILNALKASNYKKVKKNFTKELADNKEILQDSRELLALIRPEATELYLKKASEVSVKKLGKLGVMTAPKRIAAVLGTAAAEFGYLMARYGESYGHRPAIFTKELVKSGGSSSAVMQEELEKGNDVDPYFERICVEAYAIIGRAINYSSPTINIFDALCKQIKNTETKTKESTVFKFFNHFSGLEAGITSNRFEDILKALSKTNVLSASDAFEEHLRLMYEIQHPTMNHIMQAMLFLIKGKSATKNEEAIKENLMPGVSLTKAKLILKYIDKYNENTSSLLQSDPAAQDLLKLIELAKLPRNEKDSKQAMAIIESIVKRLPQNFIFATVTPRDNEIRSRAIEKNILGSSKPRSASFVQPSQEISTIADMPQQPFVSTKVRSQTLFGQNQVLPTVAKLQTTSVAVANDKKVPNVHEAYFTFLQQYPSQSENNTARGFVNELYKLNELTERDISDLTQTIAQYKEYVSSEKQNGTLSESEQRKYESYITVCERLLAEKPHAKPQKQLTM